MTDSFVLVDVVVYQDGERYRFRCAHSLDGERWSVISADNVTEPYSVSRHEQQETIFAELLGEMHPFDRMRPRSTLVEALAAFGTNEEGTTR